MRGPEDLGKLRGGRRRRWRWRRLPRHRRWLRSARAGLGLRDEATQLMPSDLPRAAAESTRAPSAKGSASGWRTSLPKARVQNLPTEMSISLCRQDRPSAQSNVGNGQGPFKRTVTQMGSSRPVIKLNKPKSRQSERVGGHSVNNTFILRGQKWRTRDKISVHAGRALSCPSWEGSAHKPSGEWGVCPLQSRGPP